MNVAPNAPQFDAFISYSSKDRRVADAVVGKLEACGLRCWVAPRNIVAGKEWSEAIIQGIESSRSFILIFTGNSNQSRQVLREVERAMAKSVPVIPFRIEDIPASKSLEYFISAQHWLDAQPPPFDKHLDKLARTVRQLVGAPAKQISPIVSAPLSTPAAATVGAAPTTTSRARLPLLLCLAGGLLLICCAGGIGLGALGLRNWTKTGSSTASSSSRSRASVDLRAQKEIDEDFHGVADGELPAGWQGDDAARVRRPKEGKPYLGVAGTEAAKVRVPFPDVHGDFLLDCDVTLPSTLDQNPFLIFTFFGEKGHDLMVRATGTGVLTNCDNLLINVTGVANAYKEDGAATDRPGNFRVRIERQGDVYRVLNSGVRILEVELPGYEDFAAVRLELPGNPETRLRLLRIAALGKD